MKITDTMVLFWGTSCVFSNWHPSVFTIGGKRYVNNEQYMMAAKARIFGDLEIEERVLALGAHQQKDMKDLGRLVKGYSDAVWIPKRERVVFDGCMAKFTQNYGMGRQLLDTGNRHMLEASPVDRIWGVGLGENDPRVLDPSRWDGLNLLGNVLMRTRTELQILYPLGTLDALGRE